MQSQRRKSAGDRIISTNILREKHIGKRHQISLRQFNNGETGELNETFSRWSPAKKIQTSTCIYSKIMRKSHQKDTEYTERQQNMSDIWKSDVETHSARSPPTDLCLSLLSGPPLWKQVTKPLTKVSLFLFFKRYFFFYFFGGFLANKISGQKIKIVIP